MFHRSLLRTAHLIAAVLLVAALMAGCGEGTPGVGPGGTAADDDFAAATGETVPPDPADLPADEAAAIKPVEVPSCTPAARTAGFSPTVLLVPFEGEEPVELPGDASGAGHVPKSIAAQTLPPVRVPAGQRAFGGVIADFRGVCLPDSVDAKPTGSPGIVALATQDALDALAFDGTSAGVPVTAPVDGTAVVKMECVGKGTPFGITLGVVPGTDDSIPAVMQVRTGPGQELECGGSKSLGAVLAGTYTVDVSTTATGDPTYRGLVRFTFSTRPGTS